MSKIVWKCRGKKNNKSIKMIFREKLCLEYFFFCCLDNFQFLNALKKINLSPNDIISVFFCLSLSILVDLHFCNNHGHKDEKKKAF